MIQSERCSCARCAMMRPMRPIRRRCWNCNQPGLHRHTGDRGGRTLAQARACLRLRVLPGHARTA